MGRDVELEDDLRALVRECTAGDAPEPFGAYLFRSADPGAELARDVERAVFLEAFGNTREMLREEYWPYEKSSVFICIVDHLRSLPAGMMRIILPSPAGFKSLNDIEGVWGCSPQVLFERTGIELSMDGTWDVATLAVAHEYRGKATMGLVSMGLYQALAMAAPQCGVDWLVAILDAVVFRLIRWKLRMPFAGFKGVSAAPYLGSPASLPVWCNVSETERRLSESEPELHELYFKGAGLEAALRPVDLGLAERLVA